MNTIEVEVKLNKIVDVEVDLHDLIDAINNVKMVDRWNYVARILNNVQADLSDVDDDKKQLIKEYLTKKLTLF